MEIITRQEAKQRGLTSYFTGKPCKRGHIASRNTNSSNCHECWREDGYQQRQRDPATFKSKKRQEYNRNKTNILAQQSAYRLRNWDRILVRRRGSVTHREYMNRYLSLYFKTNPAQRAKHLARVRKRQAQIKQALPGWAELDEISKLYEQARWLTDTTGQAHVVDHIVPLQGNAVCGLHCISNLQVITAVDNRKKWNYFDG